LLDRVHAPAVLRSDAALARPNAQACRAAPRRQRLAANRRLRRGRTPSDAAMTVLPAPSLLAVDWWALSAVIALTAGVIVLLLLELLPHRPETNRAAIVSIITLVAAGAGRSEERRVGK